MSNYCATCGKAQNTAGEIRAAESFDEKLYADPPSPEECPICCLPIGEDDLTYTPCCGNNICSGCMGSMILAPGPDRCPFCNTPAAQNIKEAIKRIFERIEKYNDPCAMYWLATQYQEGKRGFEVDHSKAIELYQRASNLGHASSHYCLANAYGVTGNGVKQRDMKKAKDLWQKAAMMGHNGSRNNLGVLEEMAGNHDRAIRHYMIAAKCGCDDSLDVLKKVFMAGKITKEDFEKALRGHQAAKDETKSKARDLWNVVAAKRAMRK